MDLSEHLLPSRSVEISVSTLDEDQKPVILKLKTVIETGYDNGFFKIVSPMHHGRMYVLHDNETISVTFTVGEEQQRNTFDISCKVIEKQHRGGQYTTTLRVTTEPRKVQRRQAFRVNILNTYSIDFNGKHLEISTKDISSTGMRILSPVQMSKDDTFAINFDGNIIDSDDFDAEPDPRRIFTINCRVVDSMPQTEIRRYMVRVQFVNLDNERTKLLIQYLYAKEAEIIAYDTNLSKQRDQLEHLIENGSDRRRGDDPIIHRYQLIGLINFAILFFAIVFLMFAQPKPLYSLDKFFDIRRAKFWDANYFTLSLALTISSLCFAGYGLALNATRMKRASDRFSNGLLISMGAAVLVLLISLYLLATQDIYNVVA